MNANHPFQTVKQAANEIPTGALNPHATEQQLASLLKELLPPILCVASEWYVYADGWWKRGTKDIFRPRALAIQNALTKTDHKAKNVLSHLESEAQVDESKFSSFHKFGDNAVLINCANGVLRVTADSVKLLQHSERYFFTSQVAASFNPEAEAPTFERVLQQALPDADDLDLFRTFIGYTLFPDCRFEAALVCYGDGGTGKSTLAEGVKAALGDDLVRSLSLLQICDPKSFHLVNLRNAAVNISAELDALPVVGAENFKLLVSGEQVAADRKHQALIQLKTSCKFWFLTNYLPRFQHGTEAELRRLRFLRFNQRPLNPDPTLKEKIVTERDGIFMLAIEGLRSLLLRQQIPQGGQQSNETRERFKVQNDPLAAFVNERCYLSRTAEIPKTDLYNQYVDFLATNGLPEPQRDSVFFRALYNRFPVREFRPRTAGVQIRKLCGIALSADE
jgi:putative DNA primase/helicase